MKRVDNAQSFKEELEAGTPLVGLLRGAEYDTTGMGPLTIGTGQEVRCLDGGPNTAIVKSNTALPQLNALGEPYEEIFRMEQGAKLSGVTLKGIVSDGSHPGLIQCGVRVLGPGVELRSVHVDGMLKQGIDIMDITGFKASYCSFKNIFYDNPDDPDTGVKSGGYGYGVWMQGTPGGAPLSEADRPYFYECTFDNLRNGIDCSQPGNSLTIEDCKFRYCFQAAIDSHRTYGFHDLTVMGTYFYSDDVNSQIRVHKLSGNALIDSCFFRTPVTKVYFDLNELPEMEAWMNREVHETDPEWESEKVTITNSRFRVEI